MQTKPPARRPRPDGEPVFEVRLDEAAPAGQILEPLARLLRAIVARERSREAAKGGAE